MVKEFKVENYPFLIFTTLEGFVQFSDIYEAIAEESSILLRGGNRHEYNIARTMLHCGPGIKKKEFLNASYFASYSQFTVAQPNLGAAMDAVNEYLKNGSDEIYLCQLEAVVSLERIQNYVRNSIIEYGVKRTKDAASANAIRDFQDSLS